MVEFICSLKTTGEDVRLTHTTSYSFALPILTLHFSLSSSFSHLSFPIRSMYPYIQHMLLELLHAYH